MSEIKHRQQRKNILFIEKCIKSSDSIAELKVCQRLISSWLNTIETKKIRKGNWLSLTYETVPTSVVIRKWFKPVNKLYKIKKVLLKAKRLKVRKYQFDIKKRDYIKQRNNP